MFTVYGGVVAQFLQQIHQVKGKVVVEVLNGALKIVSTDHLVHMLSHDLTAQKIEIRLTRSCVLSRETLQVTLVTL